MFEFETQLSKLKHEVLTEVAKLAIKDKLTKEEIKSEEIELVRNNMRKWAYENYIEIMGYN